MSDRVELRRRLRLMVITDPAATGGPIAAAENALAAGAPAIQVRDKAATGGELFAVVRGLREAVRRAGALLIVNDRLDVALAAGADGVHLGDDDIPLGAARRISPPGFLIGRSVDTPDEARIAEQSTADYVGVGPVYSTGSKSDTGPVLGAERLEEFRSAVDIPIVGIGGIGAGRARQLIEAGADGIAVIGAVMFSSDPAAATRALLDELDGARAARRHPPR